MSECVCLMGQFTELKDIKTNYMNTFREHCWGNCLETQRTEIHILKIRTRRLLQVPSPANRMQGAHSACLGGIGADLCPIVVNRWLKAKN